MGKKIKKLFKGLNMNHLRSQKFAGFLFAATLCFFAGIFQYSEPTTSAVIMGIVGCYTAFVGGRAYQDGAQLKYGGNGRTQNTVDIQVRQSAIKDRRSMMSDPEEETEEEKEVD